jgi:hypothetical protein
MTIKRPAVSVLLLLVLCAGLSAQSDRRKGPIVRQVDRILIESGDPKTLFDFFSRDLMLPEAWPLTGNRGHTSGGLGAGNVNLEFYRTETAHGAAGRKRAQARYAALALEPYPLREAIREMTVEGIPFSPPQPYVAALPNGTQGVQWTMVPLPSFSKPAMSIFLYEYSPAFLRIDVRRKQLGNRLTLNKGGPLGIQSVYEIVVAAANVEREKAAWKQLLGEPTPAGHWKIGAGPALRIVRGPEDRIQEIAFTVKSLESAREFLKKNQWLGAVTANDALLHPSKIQSLRIRLTNESVH